MNMKQSQITYWCHSIIRSQVKEGGFYIDATMGKAMTRCFSASWPENTEVCMPLTFRRLHLQQLKNFSKVTDTDTSAIPPLYARNFQIPVFL